MVRLDHMNLRIMELLQEDARRTVADIARALNRSESTVRDRISGLERAGAIGGYRALVDPRACGLAGKAVVRASADYGSMEAVARRLAAAPHVTRVYHTSGDANLAFTVVARDLEAVERFLQRTAADLGLRDVRTAVVLRTEAEAAPLPLRKLGVAPRVAEPALTR